MTATIVGQRFGRLVVTGEFKQASPESGNSARLRKDGVPYIRYRYLCECLCDCGRVKDVRKDALLAKKNPTESCGCLSIEALLIGQKSRKHGKTRTKAYRAWAGCKERCYQKSCEKYPRYGGRGIKVCDRWKDSFENFYADMGDPPTKEHSLGRIDNDGDYCPENCRWETATDQMNNTSRSVHITREGRTQTLTQWARDLGMRPGTLRRRIVDSGYSVDRAFTAEVSSPKQTGKRLLTAFGKTLCLSEWSKETGIHYTTISTRIDELGWSIEDALTKKENPAHRFIVLGDEMLTLAQWSRRTGIPYGCLKRRLQRGWDAKKALTTPLTQGSGTR